MTEPGHSSSRKLDETRVTTIAAGKKKRVVEVYFVEVPDAEARIDAAFDMIFDPLLTQGAVDWEVDDAR